MIATTSTVAEMPKASKNGSSDNSIGAMASRIKATLFGWKPGTSPVIVPSSTPSIENAMSNSSGKNESIIFF
jgi:glutamate 5-kinase